jgi:predicted alpha/beta-hydrolase family hydrolase
VSTPASPLRLRVDAADLEVSALFMRPANAESMFVLAHGAGADMHHAFMEGLAHGLATHGVATLRFQFPYAERRRKQVDRPPIAHAAVRAAVNLGHEQAGDLPLFAGGKSFGARMTSQAQAVEPLPGVRGLVFFGFPLHASGAPATERGEHLSKVTLPMLFVQGTRDALAQWDLIEARVASLGSRAELLAIEGADHGFTRMKSVEGATAQAKLATLAAAAAAWMRKPSRGSSADEQGSTSQPAAASAPSLPTRAAPSRTPRRGRPPQA